jgi:DNA-binding transcriptional LysR family regulator
MQRTNLKELAVFAAVAESRSFRTAAAHLGLTPSAVSHAMRQLEERLDMRLLNRTTRSVSLTDAGLRLFERVRPAIEQITGAVEDLAHERGRPMGRLRLYSRPLVAMAVIAPVWARFLAAYPDVQLEVDIGQSAIDIVENGYDASLGLQSWGTADMISVRIVGPFKAAFVGAPAYFSRRRPPRRPEDLTRHSCIRYSQNSGPHGPKWRFERNGETLEIAVTGSVTVNAPDLALRAALDGLGVACTVEAQAEPFLRSGQLIRVLPDWSSSVPGIFLHYPGHRQVPAALRAFIDFIHPSGGQAAALSGLNFGFAPD